MERGVSSPCLDPQLEPVLVRDLACPSYSPFMWAGWSVLKLLVLRSSLETVAFMNLFRQPVKMESCLLLSLSCPHHSTMHRAHGSSPFHLRVGWEHVHVCEKWIAFTWIALTAYSCAAGIPAWSHNHTSDYNATRCGHWLFIPTLKVMSQVPGKYRHVLAGLD